MRYKTLFRLALRWTGVFMIAGALPAVLWHGISLVVMLIDLRAAYPFAWRFLDVEFLEPLLRLALGAYLLFGGRWIVNLAIPSNRPYCAECGYELTGLPAEGECPECGTAFKHRFGTPTARPG